MIYIENIYLCMIAPILVGWFCMPHKLKRLLLFVMCGFTACLLSAYINTFFAYWYGTDLITATTEIAPVIEETMKFLPILFYLMVFEPEDEPLTLGILTIAFSFASLENVCYLVEHGTENLSYLLVRGFGTGAMHIVCGAIVGYGVLQSWGNRLFRAVGIFGVLCVAIVFHGQFNLLMSGDETMRLLACVLPVASIAVGRMMQRYV